MKKLLMTMLMAVTVMALTACVEVPELPQDVDKNFHNKALTIFDEIDEDTMEMDWEGADADDIAKINDVAVSANTDREKVFTKALDTMVELQPLVVKGDREALKSYLGARTVAMDAMNCTDTNEEGKFDVYPFEFGEEQD